MRPGRILVAEDDGDLRKVLRTRLAAAGYQVVEAGDGLEAVERVREQPPDLVILDNLMPRMNGVEACAEIRADPATSALPVILLTASPDRLNAQGSAACAADRTFVKPYDYADLLEAIGALLRGERHDDGSSTRADH